MSKRDERVITIAHVIEDLSHVENWVKTIREVLVEFAREHGDELSVRVPVLPAKRPRGWSNTY